MVQTSGKNSLVEPNTAPELDPELYDDSSGYDTETGVKMAPNLTLEEVKQANMLYHLFNELWGVCIVVGDPGTGKDLFGNYLSHKIGRYFPWKRILRDEKPRRLFGPYAGLFNPEVLVKDLARMRTMAGGNKAKDADESGEDNETVKPAVASYNDRLEKAADDWVTGAGQVMLKNSLLYLTEYWRYCYNREPQSPMNKTMGAIHKVKRHLDCLVLGTVQLPTELDKKTCLPWIDWKVTCTRSMTNRTGFVYFVQKVKYDRRLDELSHFGRPFPIAFDAAKPRTYLGDGKIRIMKEEYWPCSEEERIVLTAIKAGCDTYEELVNVLGTEGDMSEGEVLMTLKELMLNKRKRVIYYPCFFHIFNSKSAPSIKTSVKIND